MMEVIRYMATDGEEFCSQEDCRKHEEEIASLYAFYSERMSAIAKRGNDGDSFWRDLTLGYASGCYEDSTFVYKVLSELDVEMFKILSGEDVVIGENYLVTDGYDGTYVDSLTSLKKRVMDFFDRY